MSGACWSPSDVSKLPCLTFGPLSGAVGRANLRLAASAALAADRRGGPAPASSTGSAALRDGRGPYERNAKDFDALNDLVKQCNGAVLADRESFGCVDAGCTQCVQIGVDDDVCTF